MNTFPNISSIDSVTYRYGQNAEAIFVPTLRNVVTIIF